jgi:hypothetical protein
MKGSGEDSRVTWPSNVVSFLNKTPMVHKGISHFQIGPNAETFVSQPYKGHGHHFLYQESGFRKAGRHVYKVPNSIKLHSHFE